MQINLPDDVVPFLRQRAAAAGFPDQIDAYVAHLIVSDEIEDYGLPENRSVVGKSREELFSMLAAGVESGTGSPVSSSEWRKLHARVDGRES